MKDIDDKVAALEAIALDDRKKGALLTPGELRRLLTKIKDLETRVSNLEKKP